MATALDTHPYVVGVNEDDEFHPDIRAKLAGSEEVIEQIKETGDARYAPESVIETIESVAVMASPTPQNYTSIPRFRRPDELNGQPVLRASQTTAESITWANMVEDIRPTADPNRKWYLFYSTDHGDVHSLTGLYYATAPTPFGPFTDRGLAFRDDVAGRQHETPRVWWDRRIGKYVSTYSMQNASTNPIPGAIGSQVTLWATSDNLINWTRQGVLADVKTTDPGDGHTGYMNGPVVIGGQEYFYTLFGGTVRGLRTLWRRKPGGGFAVQRDRDVIGSQLNMLRGMEGIDISITGTPSTDSAVTQNGQGANTADVYWRPTHSAIIAFRGRPWCINAVGPKTPGGLVRPGTIVAVPLADNMRAMAVPPAVLDVGAPASWEGALTRFDNFGNTFTYQGRCFFMFRSGGHQGAFGIGEIY